MTLYGQKNCPACFGEGGWEDPIAEQTVICYLCRPDDYKEQAFEYKKAIGKPPTWVRGYPKVPCKYYGPRFVATPWLFVIHCGASGGNVAQFMANVGCWKKTSGRLIKVSAHFNWDNDHGGLTQGVPLHRVGWHVGGSIIEYERLKRIWPTAPDKRLRKLNFCSYGLELKGPAGRKFSAGEHNRVKALIMSLRRINPHLRVATRHMDICPTKKDPGKRFDMDVFKECGMVVYG